MRIFITLGSRWPAWHVVDDDTEKVLFGGGVSAAALLALPGQFVRSRDDGACWNNPQTSTKLCAW